jgi:hypothetical protein
LGLWIAFLGRYRTSKGDDRRKAQIAAFSQVEGGNHPAIFCRYIGAHDHCEGGGSFGTWDRCAWRDRTSNGDDRRKAQIAACSLVEVFSRPQSSVATRPSRWRYGQR